MQHLSQSVRLPDVFRNSPPTPGINPNWHRILSDAANEMVLPSLWEHVQPPQILQTVDSELREVLKAAELFNAERNARFTAECISVAAILNSIGIQPVAVKGIAYLLSGIHPPAARYLDDIDLLIPADRLPAAIEALHNHGYLAAEEDALAPFRRHAAPMQRPFAPPIELHHCVGMGRIQKILPTAEIFRDAIPLEIQHARLFIPSPTHLVNHLILHSQLLHSYRERPFPPLRALLDLRAVTKTGRVDWESLAQRYRENREYLTLALFLKQAENAIGLAPPFPLELSVFGKARWAHRQLLHRFPKARFLDPAYLSLSLFSRRWEVFRLFLHQPQRWSRFAKAAITPKYYKNLFRL